MHHSLPIVFAAAMFALSTSAQAQDYRLGPPPPAAQVEGEIGWVDLGPIHDRPYLCGEHPLGQLGFAGDALGTDCLIVGGIDDAAGEGGPGFARFYRTDGATNEDWYGWRAEVLAPVSGVVLGMFANPQVNVPGQMGRPPAGTMRILTDDGIVVVLAHLGEFMVAGGDLVERGQIVGLVGNNGISRGPHIHVGAYREADAMPLQIRWNLREMADALDTGEPEAAP